jgi:hypothetical protein
MKEFHDLSPESELERSNKSLYSKSGDLFRESKQPHLSEESRPEVSNDWENDPRPMKKIGRKSTPQAVKVFLVISLTFFALSIIGFMAIFFLGANLVSPDNIIVTVQGPSQLTSGEPAPFQIVVVNKNNIMLQNAELIIEFPSGTRVESVGEQDRPVYREFLGDIGRRGDSRSVTLSAAFFGEEGSKKEMKMRIEYGMPASSAQFVKERNYEVAIVSSPVILLVRPSVKEIRPGEPITFTVEVISNARTVLRNLALQADYPSGFEFETSDPATLADGSGWNIGELGPGERRLVTLRGTLQGQHEEERIFRFYVGERSELSLINTPFASFSESVVLKLPSLGLGIMLNDRPVRDVSLGLKMAGKVSVNWANNLSQRIRNAEIRVKITGDIIDLESFNISNGGFYSSRDSAIIWNRSVFDELADISAGRSGAVSFTFLTVEKLPSEPRINQEVRLDVSAKAEEPIGQNVFRDISSALTGTIKLASQLAVRPKILYTSGPFRNTGPLPPRAENSTTYTIVWGLDNSLNDMANVEISARIAPHVTFLGKVSPQDENVFFNPVTQRVVWEAGEVEASAGLYRPRREIAFQVSFTPALNQVGQSPIIIQPISITGRDLFTNLPVSFSAEAVTTALVSDPGFSTSQGVVVR